MSERQKVSGVSRDVDLGQEAQLVRPFAGTIEARHAPTATEGIAVDTVAARALALDLAGGRRPARNLLVALSDLNGTDWLALDEAARAWHDQERPVTGPEWGAALARADLGTVEGARVAVTAALHTSGYVRADAVLVLSGGVPSRALPAVAGVFALRLLDHVPQVRAAAASLPLLVDAEAAAVALDVALAGSGRRHGPEAMARVVEALPQEPAARFALLRSSSRRSVRRWTLQQAYRAGLLDATFLVEAATRDRDQWVRAAAARWLARSASPSELLPLLHVPRVEAQLAALTGLPDDLLDREVLTDLLSARAPRVRAQAASRARRLGLDVEAHLRRVLADEQSLPREVAAVLSELSLSGDRRDVPAAAARSNNDSPRVRAAALAVLAAHTDPAERPSLLAPRLLDPSPKVATSAARLLARTHPGSALAREAWSSSQAGSRRAARRLQRAAGGWDRVLADVRAATDPDRGIAAVGIAGVASWLTRDAANTWQPMTSAQRSELSELLTRATLPEQTRRVVAFHAGISPVPPRATRVTSDLTVGSVRLSRDLQRGRWFERTFGQRVEFVLDGRGVSDQFAETDLGRSTRHSSYESLFEAHERAVEVLTGAVPAEDWLEDPTRVPVLMCPCGDLECGALTVALEVGDRHVTWRRWAWENGHEPLLPVPELPEVEIGREAYEQVLRDAAGLAADQRSQQVRVRVATPGPWWRYLSRSAEQATDERTLRAWLDVHATGISPDQVGVARLVADVGELHAVLSAARTAATLPAGELARARSLVRALLASADLSMLPEPVLRAVHTLSEHLNRVQERA
ncbi:hypothetical protein KMZ32_01920 [Phycicoccus sp. MAQZ13P-2]|uniref:hypothetical protein n=1 Tax=Phycicoccus mangrovi TaxID=2840470 RepID=UPI001BFFF753|nr:hypothetical protein [Phycicoccus mangrovi]MBT9254450.1 hypothetical protein [Phycicoccus mangrovi]MBT9272828.1 hypothetical protein [Phycicoccus mangrovi]